MDGWINRWVLIEIILEAASFLDGLLMLIPNICHLRKIMTTIRTGFNAITEKPFQMIKAMQCSQSLIIRIIFRCRKCKWKCKEKGKRCKICHSMDIRCDKPLRKKKEKKKKPVKKKKEEEQEIYETMMPVIPDLRSARLLI